MRGQLKAQVAAKAKANGYSLHRWKRRDRTDGQFRYWLENDQHQIVATGFLLDEMSGIIDLAVEQRQRMRDWTACGGWSSVGSCRNNDEHP